jgi:hypothetical protein
VMLFQMFQYDSLKDKEETSEGHKQENEHSKCQLGEND